uniref:RNA helicase n=1 Tax=Panagrellus redivivus TaxID=6233 RepID=A0A7E4ZS86_PANRE
MEILFSAMAETWPNSYCWLYAPFLLEHTTAADFEKFSTLDERYKQFVEHKKNQNWAEDDHGVSKAFTELYKLCANGKHFQGWIKYTLKKPNLHPFNTFEPNLAVITEKMKPELFERFFDQPKSLDLVSRITGVLDIHHVVEKMDAEGYFPALVRAMKPYLEKRSTFRNWAARSHFLLLLFASDNPPNLCWYMEFLRILTTKPTTRLIARFIDDNFEETISYYAATVKQAHIDKVKKIVNFASPHEPAALRPQKDFGEVKTEDKHVDNIIKLYDYQHELANKAISGENTIVCAPTGSGKTVVAAYIVRDHLRRTADNGKVGRAIVFVPTIILVEQQTTVLQKLLGSEFMVTSLCGAEPKYATNKVLEVMVGDVVVMTPQVFLNLYMSPIKERKIYIRDFTLMVFDECHHCDKKHPYRIIMNAVMKTRTIKSENRTIPQVVGLTASVGAGELKSADSTHVMTHITALCSRMGATSISSVQHASNMEEMKARVPKPVDDFVTVHPPQRDQFAIELSNIARDIEYNLEPVLKKIVEKSGNLSYDKVLIAPTVACNNGSQRTNVRYTSKLASVKDYVKQSRLEMSEKAYAYWLLDFLMKIHYALKYNELLPSAAAMQYVLEGYQAVIDDINTHKNTRFDDKIKKDIALVAKEVKENLETLSNSNNVRDAADKNVLNMLIMQIKKQFDQNQNSRILVFIDLRRGCYDLSIYLNHHPMIIQTFGRDKVSYLMGSQTSGKKEVFHKSRAEQAKIRSDFEKGNINILVTTSVSDEGVDVASCNLVIKYNSVGNEKTYIQRRGRARAAGGRAVLIALGVDTGRREYNNIFRECIMNRCLSTLATMNSQEIRTLIEKRNAEQAQLEKLEKSRGPVINQNYSIHCGSCNGIIGETKQLRLLQDDTMVLCNPGIWDKLFIDRLNEKRLDERIASIRCATAKCASCKHTWGPMVKYADLYLVSPKLDGIRINGVNYDVSKDSWHRLMQESIHVDELQQSDLAVMFNDHLGDKEVELEIAIQQQVKNIIAKNRRNLPVNQLD